MQVAVTDSLRPVNVLLALLTLVAVLVALARPVCEAYDLGGGAHDHGDCYTPLADGARTELPAAAAEGVKPPFLAASTAQSLRWRAPDRPPAAIPADRPPISRPYHARSARILT
jgi:hypothetical protein